MHTATLTLTDFLLARITEDEAAARAADEEGAYPHFGDTAADETLEMALSEGCAAEGAAHFRRWLPDHVLAECEAKRRIVEAALDFIPTEGSMAEAALLHLALPYADHPDYRQEWKP